LGVDVVERFLEVLQEDDASIVVLGSTTPGIFSAGADLQIPDAERYRLSDLLYACYEAMVTRRGPVIAVVEGPAVGGGAQLTTAADIRVATQASRWRWAGPGHGLAVGAWILPSIVGRSLGMELCLTSRWVTAEEALSAGLVSRIESDPWGHVRELLDVLSHASPEALAHVKQVANGTEIVRTLREERRLNADSWDGSAPTPSEAAAESRSRSAPGSE
jgi:enoyl-CoA hydratase/carnithine racemase